MTNPDRTTTDTSEDRDTTPERTGERRTRSRTRSRSRAGDGPTPGDDGPRRSRRSSDDRAREPERAPSDTADGEPNGETQADDTGDDGSPSTSSRRRRGRRGRGGRGRRGGRGATAERGSKDAATPAAGTTDGDADQATESKLTRGCTRVAAKRGGRDGRGGNGGRARPGGVPEEVRRAILEGPPRTMLVTAREDRTQIAVLEDRTVVEHFVTREEDVTYVGNIYMARVQNVLPGMEAAFLDIGTGRNGVLYAGEVLYDELDLEEGADQRIENVLKAGQKVLVQVTKDPMGSKGPRLTMRLSLAGRYMVLAPDSDLFGISRKLTDKERDRLRKIVKTVKPSRHGVIVRTAGENATEEQLTADLERLLAKWSRVEERAADSKALTAVYEEPPLVVKVIRDNFGPEFERCVVDSESLHAQVREYLDEVAPELIDKIELYRDAGSKGGSAADEDDDAKQARAARKDGGKKGGSDGSGTSKEADAAVRDLFDAYHVSEQLRRAMGRKLWLPSGGYLVVEATEAMKVIDVNTGKFTGDADANLEEIVLKTNLEAAEEIVRQLRLRDMGGIIVIDFIDMLLKSNQDQVVRRLKRELLRDRTKTRVSDVSRLGLVQMTRKNVSKGLVESFSHVCESCDGHGYISELA